MHKSFFKGLILKSLSFYPPYLGAGVRVTNMSSNLRAIDVEMKLRFWNQNYVGTHFGGSLYSMTDPFYMLMLLENLGNNYVVWDKAGSIVYKKPGKGRVKAEFRLTQDQLDKIVEETSRNYKYEPEFKIAVVDEEGDVVAEVTKTIYIRKKIRENDKKT